MTGVAPTSELERPAGTAMAWFLKSRPQGPLQEHHLELRPTPLASLTPGAVRVRNEWLSVDPYMRGKMTKLESYTPPYALDEPLSGGAVGVVVESAAADLVAGDRVQHRFGWRDTVVAPAAEFRKLPDTGVPPQRYLDSLGVTGRSAYFGLLRVADACEGDVVFVSAAGGAVGSMVVQIAKLRGMTVIASAGGAAKCQFVRDLGADLVIDYKAEPSLSAALRRAAPDGIDVYFDNVGGDHLDAALAASRRGARICICGMIAGYDQAGERQPTTLQHLMQVIGARITLRGFLVSDFNDEIEPFEREMASWLKAGLIRSPETVREGLAAAPGALRDLFRGSNTGKMLIRLS